MAQNRFLQAIEEASPPNRFLEAIGGERKKKNRFLEAIGEPEKPTPDAVTLSSELAESTAVNVIAGGLRDAAQSTFEIPFEIAETVVQAQTPESLAFLSNIPGIPAGERESLVKRSIEQMGRDRGQDIPQLPEVAEPESVVGSMARDLIQFSAGFFPANRALKGVGALGTIGRGIVAGGAADVTVFAPDEERLSNLVQSIPALRNPITEFLAASPGDTGPEGRLKNLLEGSALGVTADVFFASLRGLRHLRRAGNAASEAARNAEQQAAEAAFKQAERVANKPRVRITGQRDGKPVIRITPDPLKPQVASGSQAPASAVVDAAVGAPRDVQPTDVVEAAGELLTPRDPVLQARPGGRVVEVAGNINLDRLDTPESVKDALANVARARGGFDEARRGVVSNEDTKKVAAQMGMTVEQLLKRRKGQAFKAEDAFAARTLLATVGDDVVSKAQAAIGGSEEALLAFRQALARHVAVQEQVAGITAEAGRALQQFKIAASATRDRDEIIKGIIEQGGGRDVIERKASMLAALTTPEQVAKFTRKAWKPKTIDKVMEAYYNFLLSGATTHIVNAGSNSLVALYTIPERAVAATFGLASRGERVFFRETTAQASGMYRGMKEGWKGAVEVFKSGSAPGAGTKLETRFREAIPGIAGKVIRVPGRALEASDTFFKTLVYAGEMEAQAVRKGIQDGLSGSALKARVAELIEAPTDEMHKRAWRRAKTNTFTTSLRDQEGLLAATGKALQDVKAKHPSIGVIVPFIRTPTNILKFSISRSALGVLMKDVRREIAAGGARRQRALGEMAMGSVLAASTVPYILDGTISGGGPSDFNAQRIKRMTGWQPYSIKVGDTWYSYARFEPLGTLIGVTADTAEIMDAWGGGAEIGKLAPMVMLAFAKNGTNKTFLRGMSEAFDAINNPERDGARFIETMAGAGIPTGMAHLARANDPVVRDVRGILDRLKSRTPGLTKDVEPLLNLWGEEVWREGGAINNLLNPVYISTDKKDDVADEMVRLKMSPSMPKRDINGIPLTPVQYNDYVRFSGSTSRQLLGQIISGEEWKSIPDGVKVDIITDTLSRLRAVGRGRTMQKYPELIQGRVTRAQERAGITQ